MVYSLMRHHRSALTSAHPNIKVIRTIVDVITDN